MNRRKVRALVRSVIEERDALRDSVVTFDNLTISFADRTVRFRGRTIEVPEETPSIVFPMLSTDRMVLTKTGEDVA